MQDTNNPTDSFLLTYIRDPSGHRRRTAIVSCCTFFSFLSHRLTEGSFFRAAKKKNPSRLFSSSSSRPFSIRSPITGRECQREQHKQQSIFTRLQSKHDWSITCKYTDIGSGVDQPTNKTFTLCSLKNAIKAEKCPQR